jgi:hypothetical protein
VDQSRIEVIDVGAVPPKQAKLDPAADQVRAFEQIDDHPFGSAAVQPACKNKHFQGLSLRAPQGGRPLSLRAAAIREHCGNMSFS